MKKENIRNNFQGRNIWRI